MVPNSHQLDNSNNQLSSASTIRLRDEFSGDLLTSWLMFCRLGGIAMNKKGEDFINYVNTSSMISFDK